MSDKPEPIQVWTTLTALTSDLALVALGLWMAGQPHDWHVLGWTLVVPGLLAASLLLLVLALFTVQWVRGRRS